MKYLLLFDQRNIKHGTATNRTSSLDLRIVFSIRGIIFLWKKQLGYLDNLAVGSLHLRLKTFLAVYIRFAMQEKGC